MPTELGPDARRAPPFPPPHTVSDAPLLAGRYRPVERSGVGGSSSVFRGTDETLGRQVAIKVFHSGGAHQLERHADEIRVLASLAHHGIVGIIDAGIDVSQPNDARPFLVMELVTGTTLEELSATRRPSARVIGEIGFEIAETLAYIHAHGVIHRDVTPTNIMLADYGTPALRRRALLTDFGIAVEGGSVPGAETAVGTAPYLSPEQATGAPLDSATDIYSLGLVLLETFTGRREFPGTYRESMEERVRRDPMIGRDVPGAWRSLLRAMTAREPRHRPDAGAVLESSRRILRARPR